MHSRQQPGTNSRETSDAVTPSRVPAMRAMRNLQLRPVTCRSLVASLLGMTLASVLASGSLIAQQRTDTSATVDTAGPRPEMKPPMSPRRAFISSLFLPGYAQSILGRNRAGSLQLAFEAIALVMIRISAADVREARRTVADSIPVSFVDASGLPVIRYERTPFSTSLLRSRQSHLEDWIAVLMANHLFSAADGYVAALLWDLPAEVALNATPRSAGFALRLRW
jgi:hypothetical protein